MDNSGPNTSWSNFPQVPPHSKAISSPNQTRTETGFQKMYFKLSFASLELKHYVLKLFYLKAKGWKFTLLKILH